ncbi:hypothetical protein GCM10027402_23310 [Arthrobacter monumenti]
MPAVGDGRLCTQQGILLPDNQMGYAGPDWLAASGAAVFLDGIRGPDRADHPQPVRGILAAAEAETDPLRIEFDRFLLVFAPTCTALTAGAVGTWHVSIVPQWAFAGRNGAARHVPSGDGKVQMCD